MAYKLRATGIAANCTMCVAVDPDTLTIKDFSSSAVTADMIVHQDITAGIGSQGWNGKTRHYFELQSGKYVGFGTAKPRWEFNVEGQRRTIVWIGKTGGYQARVIGKDSSNYVAACSLASGGNTMPQIYGMGYGSSGATGGNASFSAGDNAIFGFSLVHGVSGIAYSALHDAEAMTSVVQAAPPTSGGGAFDVAYVGRRNDSTGQDLDKIHAVLIFDDDLSEAEWDSLRDDWFSVLLEPASAAATIILSPDPVSVVNGGTQQITITRSTAAPAGGGVTYNLVSDTPASATVPATVNMAEGQTTVTFNVTGVSVGSATITATNAADSGETDSITANVVTVRKLKLLAHIDALGATAVKGAVFAAPSGGALVGAKVGEFTGGAFKAVAESGQAPLEVAVGDFGGSALTTADTPVCVWEGTSAATSALGNAVAIGSVGPHECTVIEV